MPLKDFEISSLSMIDLTTGREVININPPTLSDLHRESLQFSTDEKMEIPMYMSGSFDCDTSNINLHKLFPNSPNGKYTMEADIPNKVQNRTHKRWRINKKWAKRYGYKTINKRVKLDIISMEDNRDGSFDFNFKCDFDTYKDLVENAVTI